MGLVQESRTERLPVSGFRCRSVDCGTVNCHLSQFFLILFSLQSNKSIINDVKADGLLPLILFLLISTTAIIELQYCYYCYITILLV